MHSFLGAQEIQELPVKCVNYAVGCQWEGMISTINYHATACEFALVVCPNKCETSGGVYLELMRSGISEHLHVCPNREFHCDYCKEKGTYAGITGEHDKVCKKKMVTCPNGQCGIQVKRGKIGEHIQTDCAYGIVPCKYKPVGCEVVKARMDMTQHEEEDIKSHLDLAMNELAYIKEKSITLRFGESIGLKVSGFSRLKKGNECFYSDPFYSIEGYKIRLAIDANGCGEGEGTHLSVSIELLDGKRENESERLVKGIVLIVLLNQLSDSFHFREMFRLKNAEVGQVLGIPCFISHADLCSDSSGEVQFLLEDTLYFRVTVQSSRPKEWLDCGVKVNAPLTRMIDDFISLKQEPFVFKLSGYGIKTKFVSNSFNVSPCYSMAIVVLDYNTNPCLEVHCSVKRSRSITSLIWPFSGTIKVDLLNQMEDKNHHVKCLQLEGTTIGNEDVVAYGLTNFIPKSSLNGSGTSNVQFLMNGILYFRVKVSVDSQYRKPWLECKSGLIVFS